MVGALTTLFNEPNVSLGITRREADALPEICLRDGMGTGARHQKSFRLQQLQAQEVDILIASQRTSQGLLATSEGRRIEDHHSSSWEIRATHRSRGYEELASVGVHG